MGLLLRRRRLNVIRGKLDSLLGEARRMNLAQCQALTLLCERDIARWDASTVEMATKSAHLPSD